MSDALTELIEATSFIGGPPKPAPADDEIEKAAKAIIPDPEWHDALMTVPGAQAAEDAEEILVSVFNAMAPGVARQIVFQLTRAKEAVSKAYNPDQPRQPRGSSQGGQWMSAGSPSESVISWKRPRGKNPSVDDVLGSGAFPKLDAMIRDMIGKLPNGYYDVDIDTSSGEGLYFSILGKARAGIDEPVGISIIRRIGEGAVDGEFEIDHETFKLDASIQNMGFAPDVLKAALPYYDKMNIKTIGVEADMEVGGYVWAKAGFESRFAKDREEITRRALRWSVANEVGAFRTSIESWSDKDYMYNMAHYKSPTGNTAGKSALLGSSWYGTMDLTDRKQRARYEAFLEDDSRPRKKKAGAEIRSSLPIYFEHPAGKPPKPPYIDGMAYLSGEPDLLALAVVRDEAGKLTKAGEVDGAKLIIEAIVQDLDLDELTTLAAELPQTWEDVIEFEARRMLAKVGLGDDWEEMFHRVNIEAVDYARQHGAELVGKRWVRGRLVDNPDAKWRIDEPTRRLLRDDILRSFQEGYGIDQLYPILEKSYAFSLGRARLIARTEALNAANAGAEIGQREARDAGVSLKKTWLAAPDACDICLENAAAGAIDLDDEFPSGDQRPTAHPNCRCALGQEVDFEATGKVQSFAFATRSELRALVAGDLEIVKAYNPDQPRHPAGSSQGGKWAPKEGGGASAGSSAPSKEEQDEGIKGIADYLDMTTRIRQPRDDGIKYPDQFVLDNGKPYYMDENTFKGKMGPQKLCYMNAGRMALDGKGTYVEGYVNVGLPIAHAWIERDGKVIETTIRDKAHVKGYYGVPYETEYLRETILDRGIWGIQAPHGPDDRYVELLSGKRPDAIGKALAYDWDEAKHPRQPKGTEIGGQFASADGTGAKEQDNEADPDAGLTASQLYDKYHQEGTTLQDILSDPNLRVDPDHAALAIKTAEERLKGLPATDALVPNGFKDVDEHGNEFWTKERAELHERILKDIFSERRMAAALPAEGVDPELLLFGGRGGSGKGWFSGDDGPVDTSHYIKLDADDIKAQLPGYAGWNAALYHEESGYVFDKAVDIARERGLNLVLDQTMKTQRSAMAKVDAFAGSGYRISAYYMFAPPREAAVNATRRFVSPRKGGSGTGRYVPPSYIFNSTTNERTFDAIVASGKLEGWAIYSTQGQTFPPKRIGGKP